MDLLNSLASLALAYPSTPVHLQLEWVDDQQQWEAVVFLQLNPDESWPVIAEAEGTDPMTVMCAIQTQLADGPTRVQVLP